MTVQDLIDLLKEEDPQMKVGIVDMDNGVVKTILELYPATLDKIFLYDWDKHQFKSNSEIVVIQSGYE